MNATDIIAIIVIVLCIFLSIIFIYVFFEYNDFIKMQNRVNEAFSTMDICFKKRWDLIPNIVEIVKEYANYESNTLTKIIESRNSSYDSMSNEEKLNKNENMRDDITKIFALRESYPDLKANENFLKLSDELTQIENDIANSRKYYNAVVREFNTKLQIVPNNVIAKIYKFEEMKLFEASLDEKKNVSVKVQ